VISLFEELSDGELARIAESCSTRPTRKNAHFLGEQGSTTDVSSSWRHGRAKQRQPQGSPVSIPILARRDLGEFSAMTAAALVGGVGADRLRGWPACRPRRSSSCLRSNCIVATKLVELLVVKIRTCRSGCSK